MSDKDGSSFSQGAVVPLLSRHMVGNSVVWAQLYRAAFALRNLLYYIKSNLIRLQSFLDSFSLHCYLLWNTVAVTVVVVLWMALLWGHSGCSFYGGTVAGLSLLWGYFCCYRGTLAVAVMGSLWWSLLWGYSCYGEMRLLWGTVVHRAIQHCGCLSYGALWLNVL